MRDNIIGVARQITRRMLPREVRLSLLGVLLGVGSACSDMRYAADHHATPVARHQAHAARWQLFRWKI